MSWILDKEGVEHEDDAVLTIIDHSGGHVRDVINKLEMIGQLGPISLEAVRDNLNLAAVSTYYQILLALANPVEALRLAEEACDRVGPEEVSEGLAEAAMNAYRLAHNMQSEFSYFDRVLATKVYDVYKDTSVHLAEYFLRSYKVSRMSLFSEILACHSGVPAKVSDTPIRISVVASPQAPSTASVPPGSVPEVDIAPKASSQAAVVPEDLVPATPVGQSLTPKAPAAPPSGRPDNIGNLGSGDPEALTLLDIHAVPRDPPRGHESVVPHRSVSCKERILTADEWKIKFAQRLEAASWGR
jgi:hypothetical protein